MAESMDRAVFLDRDGTLIEDRGYICKFSQVGVYPFAVEAVKIINHHHHKCVVVTNQSAVARGICTDHEVRQLHEELRQWFYNQGAVIDAFYYCPYLEAGSVAPYNIRSSCRKPEPGMLIQAARDLSIELNESYMIGDHVGDIQAGHAAGCKTLLVRTGHGKGQEAQLPAEGLVPDFKAENLLEAIRWIFPSQAG
jgi:D-glycero-D-manno-heptose 1,7-bisphosphate phosphatase